MRVRNLAAAAVVAALVALSACSGAEESKPPESRSEDRGKPVDGGKTPDTEPSPTGGDRTPSEGRTGSGEARVGGAPKPVDAGTEAKAKSVVVRFLRAYTQAGNSGDTSGMERQFTDECDRCVTTVNIIERIYQGGGRVEGGGYLDPEPVVEGRESDGRILVTVRSDYAAYKILDSSGNVTKSFPTKLEPRKYWLKETGEGLRIVWWT